MIPIHQRRHSSSAPSLDIPILQERGTCYGLRSHFGILADGTVVPCCLDKEGTIPLGNIDDKNILEILDGSRAQKILKGFREGRLEEELCKRCSYIERFQKKKHTKSRLERPAYVSLTKSNSTRFR